MGIVSRDRVWDHDELKKWMLEEAPQEPVPTLYFEAEMRDLRVWRKGVFTNKELDKHNFNQLEDATFGDCLNHEYWLYSFVQRP